MEKIKQGFYDSMERFNRIDGNSFGACINEVSNYNENTCLEWRIRKADDKLCIIQYYGKGQGYAIFVIE